MLDITSLPSTPFTTADAAAWGIGPEQLAAAVAESELHHPLRGIYLRGDIELTMLARAQAARPVTSPFSVVCDRTAAWIHQIDVISPASSHGAGRWPRSMRSCGTTA